MSKEVKEVYGRIKHLSKMVVNGEVDPLDIDITTLVKLISQVDVDRLPINLFMEDVDALNGLSIVLYHQKEYIKRYLEGLKLDEMLVKTAILTLSLEELASILNRIYRPPAEVSNIDNDFIYEFLLYFKNLRRLEHEFSDKPIQLDHVEYPIEEDVRKEMERLWRHLLSKYRDKWVEYYEVVKENPVFTSYLISLLASEGYILLVKDRISGKVMIKPMPNKIEFRNPVSIPVVVNLYGYGEED